MITHKNRRIEMVLLIFFFQKSEGDIVIASVCPLCCFLLNHWTKSNQIWCVSYSHEWGLQQQIVFGPRPLGPWGGVTRSNIIKSQFQSNFQRFLF